MRILLVSLLLVPFLSACGGGGGGSPGPNPEPVRERITIAGAGSLGIFDPSVAREPIPGRLWMSYSSVDASVWYAPATYWAVSIRLAFSDDGGDIWQDAGVVAPYNEILVGPLTTNPSSPDIAVNSLGIWQSETSSLIYDPGAPAAERWKLIWFQYLNTDLTSHFADYSWIAMKAAANPTALAAAPAVKLFGGHLLQPQNTLTVAPTFAPVGGAPLIQLNTDLTQSLGSADPAELNACVFTEPGLHATAAAVYLTLYCADLSGPITQYVVYFRCNNPCTMTDAGDWEYGGRLVGPADAAVATSDDFYQAPAIVEQAGETYLSVTPVDNSAANDRYNGCRMYKFTDIDSGSLQRSAGVLVEHARVDGDVGSHHGACEAEPGMDGGIMLSQAGAPGTSEAFQIFKSQVEWP